MFDDALKFTIKIKGYEENTYHIYADDIQSTAQTTGYFVFDENDFCRYFPIHMVECVVIGDIKDQL